MKISEYKRNLMVVKDIDSDIISEAYFVLKSGAEYEYGEKVSEEAERIVRELSGSKKKKKNKGVTLACICIACVFAAIAISAFIFSLIAS